MRTFILASAIVLSFVSSAFAFNFNSTKAIYPVSAIRPLAKHKAKKTVYGIYANNQYWAITKKPNITKLTNIAKRSAYPCAIPYHVKLFMRFSK